MTRVPFDAFISQAVSSEVKEFASACHLLESLASHGRAEAGVFLLGLLSFNRDDPERLKRVVEALRSFRCPASAQAFWESSTVSSGRTRLGATSMSWSPR